MKSIIQSLLILAVMSLILPAFGQSIENDKTNETKKSLYDFKMESLTGDPIDFKQFKGKKLLLVNVASKCGFTPQYEDLQKLHEQYGDKVTIVGIPANNFGKQEPGSHEEIVAFCEKNYGVKFLMMEKISVKGDDMHPLYLWLSTKELNGTNNKSPNWNFCKYLIDENGNILSFFPSTVKPLSDKIIDLL